MQVGHHIAQAREVDLVWAEFAADEVLGGPDYVHQLLSIGGGELGHFRGVAVEHDAEKAWQCGLIDGHHAAQATAPQEPTSSAFTQLATLSAHETAPRGSGVTTMWSGGRPALSLAIMDS